MKSFLVTLIALLLITQTTNSASNTLKVKQHIGKSTVLYYDHSTKNLNGYVLYQPGDKSWLMVGLGPRFVLPIHNRKLRISSFFIGRFDTNNPVWPIKDIGADTYFSLKINKWICYNRIFIHHDLTDPGLTWWSSGRIYGGYQTSRSFKLLLQTEWRKKTSLLQSVGMGWLYRLNETLTLNGYIGEYVAGIHGRQGWFELKVKL